MVLSDEQDRKEPGPAPLPAPPPPSGYTCGTDRGRAFNLGGGGNERPEQVWR